MKRREQVSTILTKNVHTVQLDDSLVQVRDLMHHHGIRHVPVIQGKQLVGIISKTDINRLTFSSLFAGQEPADEAVFEMLNIGQVMSHKPRVVKISDSIHEVAEILAQEEFHALPVVDDQDENKLVGIVTTTDVIKYMLAQY
ncbi:MAG: CBS domain-containing protein [Bacteroidota bacterium]